MKHKINQHYLVSFGLVIIALIIPTFHFRNIQSIKSQIDLEASSQKIESNTNRIIQIKSVPLITPTLTLTSMEKLDNIHAVIQQIIDKYPKLTLNISFHDITTGDNTDINGGLPVIAASTIKVMVACDFLEKVQNGKYRLDMMLGNHDANYHLNQMIVQSNNNSWTSFNNLLTYAEEKAYAKKIGITYNSDNNSISTNDMAILLAKLYKGELLNAENTKLLLNLMSKTHDDRFIPGANVKADYFHKTGKLDGYVHDAGILDDGTNKYAIVIFSNGTMTLDQRILVFHEIVEKIYAAAII